MKARSYNNCNSSSAADPGGNCAYIGTMYPWESAFTGLEVCRVTRYACRGRLVASNSPAQQVCPGKGGTCWYEQHITGDIAFAIWQYYSATGDIDWLRKVGYPMLFDIATFWASRGMRCVPIPLLYREYRALTTGT
jgi:trehalose/maltose hydrolase-like predicted phosphorylase